MSSYQYRKSHCGDKTILRRSYLHNGVSYTGKTTSLYWIGALLDDQPVGRLSVSLDYFCGTHKRNDLKFDMMWKNINKLILFQVQYIPRNMHTVFALLCFVMVIHWLIFPYPSGLLHWHCGNLRITPVPAKQPWWIWINTSCEFIMNDCITTTKQSTTRPCAYFLGYTVMA